VINLSDVAAQPGTPWDLYALRNTPEPKYAQAYSGVFTVSGIVAHGKGARFFMSLEKAQDVSVECDMIVNATTIGLDSEPSPVDHEHIKKGCIVYDMVYRPIVTDLIENAKYAQAIVVYGYEMLIEQGAKAFEIWTGLPAPREAMKKNLLGIFGEPV